MNAIAFLLPLALFPLAGALVYFALRKVTRAREIAATPTTPAASVAGGRVEIAGIAEPGPRGLVKAPYSGQDVLYVRYTLEERVRGKNGDKWKRIDAGESGAPFLLRDESGAVLVEAFEGEILAPERTISLASDGPRLDVRTTPGAIGIDLRARPRRARETTILPGTRLYALGDATPNPPSEGASWRIASGDQKLLLSTRTEKALRSALRAQAAGLTVGALALGALATFLAYAAWTA